MHPFHTTASRKSSPDAARTHGLRKLCLLPLLVLCLCFALPALAQTGGEGGIQGTIVDATGASIPDATVTATNNATGVSEKRQTTSAGLYTISPILPGTYTVTATAQGFNTVTQKNLTVNALALTPLDITLTVGLATTEVTVTTAPPQLETTNATLGMTIENTAYTNLPLQLNGAQRDPTAFAALAPGAQGGARLPIIGGTGNYLGQLYLDGLPAETVSQQGDNRLVSQAVSVDAVDQMQVVTSTPPAEYSGAGAANFSMKSGGLKYHGSVQDFIRNTAFDAWQFNKGATKPVDHQNELSATIGGHVPGTHRLFFFFAYDRYHNRTYNNPVTTTIPTLQMRKGDFSQLACLNITNACRPPRMRPGRRPHRNRRHLHLRRHHHHQHAVSLRSHHHHLHPQLQPCPVPRPQERRRHLQRHSHQLHLADRSGGGTVAARTHQQRRREQLHSRRAGWFRQSPL